METSGKGLTQVRRVWAHLGERSAGLARPTLYTHKGTHPLKATSLLLTSSPTPCAFPCLSPLLGFHKHAQMRRRSLRLMCWSTAPGACRSWISTRRPSTGATHARRAFGQRRPGPCSPTPFRRAPTPTLSPCSTPCTSPISRYRPTAALWLLATPPEVPHRSGCATACAGGK